MTNEDNESAGPLAGMRVVDLTTILLGPVATQMLGDLGADVIRVESPGGDVFRGAGPPPVEDGMGALFLTNNRNKRGIVLDLKDPRGLEAMMRLLESADAFVHNMRPQAIDRLGLDYAAVSARSPSIVYCGSFGFRRSGPYGHKPAYDDMMQAASGLAALQAVDGEPRHVKSVIADKVTGVHVAVAVLAALVHRARTGEGQCIEVPMFETLVAFNMLEHLYGKTYEPPRGSTGYPRALSPDRRPYRTRDGWVGALPYTDAQWAALFEIAKRPDLAEDPRFATLPSRLAHIDDRAVIAGDTNEYVGGDRSTVSSASLGVDAAENHGEKSGGEHHADRRHAVGAHRPHRAPAEGGADHVAQAPEEDEARVDADQIRSLEAGADHCHRDHEEAADRDAHHQHHRPGGDDVTHRRGKAGDAQHGDEHARREQFAPVHVVGEPADRDLPAHRAEHEHREQEGRSVRVEALLDAVYRKQSENARVDEPEHERRQHEGGGDAQEVAHPGAGLAAHHRRRAPGEGERNQGESDHRHAQVERRPGLAAQDRNRERSDRESGVQEHPLHPDEAPAGAVAGHLVDPDVAGGEREIGGQTEAEADRKPRPHVGKDGEKEKAHRHAGDADRHHRDGAHAADQARREGRDDHYRHHLDRGAQPVQPGRHTLPLEEDREQGPGEAQRDRHGSGRGDAREDASSPCGLGTICQCAGPG